jgi:hypothetical protein
MICPVCNAARGPKASFEICSYLWAIPFDIEFPVQDRFAFVAGKFAWPGFDYLQPFEAKERNAYNGFSQAIVRSTGQPGRISLRAASPDLGSVTCDLKAK